jgi:hypothetical protein
MKFPGFTASTLPSLKHIFRFSPSKMKRLITVSYFIALFAVQCRLLCYCNNIKIDPGNSGMFDFCHFKTKRRVKVHYY